MTLSQSLPCLDYDTRTSMQKLLPPPSHVRACAVSKSDVSQRCFSHRRSLRRSCCEGGRVAHAVCTMSVNAPIEEGKLQLAYSTCVLDALLG